MLVNFAEVWINNLLEKYEKNSWYYMPRENAYKRLKHVTQQDFEYDAESWKRWFREEENPYTNFSSMNNHGRRK